MTGVKGRNRTMLWSEDIPDGPEYYTHVLWQWNGNVKPWAEQNDLPEIILHGKTKYERMEAIRLLQSEMKRAELACRVTAPEEVRCLISGIHNQAVLIFLAVSEKHSVPARLYALDYICEPETLRIIAHTDCIPVRSYAFERIVSMAETPEQWMILANDDSVPIYNRIKAALRLVEGSELSDTDVTELCRKSNVVRFVIEQKKPQYSDEEK